MVEKFHPNKTVLQIHNNKTIKTSVRVADLLATIQTKNPTNISLVCILICSKLSFKVCTFLISIT
jgi:hypothetical protein